MKKETSEKMQFIYLIILPFRIFNYYYFEYNMQFNKNRYRQKI